MEKPVHRIVFATDFSACSIKAFGYALALAKFFEAQLTIVHVVRNYASLDIEEAIVYVNIEEQVQGSRDRLEKHVSSGRAHVPKIQSEILFGIPADKVCQFAFDNEADLIIIGAHGWSGLDRVLLGSVAERVICQAPCPVLSVPAREDKSFDWADTPESIPIEHVALKSGHLLLPVDFTDCSLEAFEYASGLAKSCHMSVSLLHAVEPLSYSLDFNLSHPIENRHLRENVETRLSELTAVLRKENIRADYRLGERHAVDAILEGIKTTQPNLVVMGTHGRRGLTRLVMGSVATGVLRKSFSPILTVKSPRIKQKSSHET